MLTNHFILIQKIVLIRYRFIFYQRLVIFCGILLQSAITQRTFFRMYFRKLFIIWSIIVSERLIQFFARFLLKLEQRTRNKKKQKRIKFLFTLELGTGKLQKFSSLKKLNLNVLKNPEF